MNNDLIMEMRNIDKRFPGVQALDDVSINIRRDNVNVLVGENGAGKSTLMKILAGALKKDSGDILIDGQPIEINTPQDSMDRGIAMIYQELNLVQEMSVAENIALGSALNKTFLFDKKAVIKKATSVLKEYDLDLSPTEQVKNLSIAKQQMVEIAKALSRNVKILVMDEPTSSLSKRDADHLLNLVRSFVSQGVSIIYISHRMEEIFSIGDYVTVMCDGKTVGEWAVRDVTEKQLISSMVGREIVQLFPKIPVDIGNVVMQVDHLTKADCFENISFDVRRGEIFGFSGLVGAGRTELFQAVFGARSYDSGSIILNGKTIGISSPSDAIKNRIAYVPEDRKLLGLNLQATIRNNISTTNEQFYSQYGVINSKKENALSKRMINKLRVKCTSALQTVKDLSGGNQQKVVLAKWLVHDLDVLILDEPTRGIDVGSKEEIYHLIIEFATQGLAVILISSDLSEILGMSDRIAVMHEGRLTAILNVEDANQEVILTYASGLAPY